MSGGYDPASIAALIGGRPALPDDFLGDPQPAQPRPERPPIVRGNGGDRHRNRTHGAHRDDRRPAADDRRPAAKGGDGAKGKKPDVFKLLMEIGSALELFVGQDGAAYAAHAAPGGRRETWRIQKGRGFRKYLSREYYQRTYEAAIDRAEAAGDAGEPHGLYPAAEPMDAACNTLTGMAEQQGAVRDVAVRVAWERPPADRQTACIAIDLGDATGEAAIVTPDGWHIGVPEHARFLRPDGIRALPRPRPGGTIAALRPCVNVASDEDFILLVSWLVAALHPEGPYPVLVLSGGQGSAKSTTSSMLRRLIDASRTPTRAEPREARDLAIAADNNWIAAFDNVTALPVWLADALCRLSTGAGFAVRSLYSDRDEELFYAKRPILLNGIGNITGRNDLLDRAVTLTLPEIAPGARQTEAECWQAFDDAAPAVFGALLDGLARLLRDMEQVRPAHLPRMADFARKAAAAAPAFGWSMGDFLAAYERNRGAAHEAVIDQSLIAAPLLKLLALRDRWQGTSSELLSKLTDVADASLTRRREWPGTPEKLSNALDRLAPTLAAAGVTVERSREGRARRRVWYITHNAREEPSAPSAPSAVDSKWP